MADQSAGKPTPLERVQLTWRQRLGIYALGAAVLIASTVLPPSRLALADVPPGGPIVVGVNAIAALDVSLSIETSPVTPIGMVTATWRGLLEPDGADIVGLFEPGAPNTKPLSRVYTNGRPATVAPSGAGIGDGSVDLPIPAGLVAGNRYEVRLVSGASGATVAGIVVVAPASGNDSYAARTGGVLDVPAPGVLANDTDGDPTAIQARVVANPAHGLLALRPDGAFGYVPSPGFSGTDSFTYQAAARQGFPATATVTIDVAAAPTAIRDGYAVVSGSTLTVQAPGILANDTDARSQHLTATVATMPAHGTLTLKPDGSFTYTPNADFAGTDGFSYRAGDGSVQSTPTTVAIAVTPTECLPRPRVQAAPAAGSGKLQVHVESTPLNTRQPNPLKQIKFGAFENARVTLNGQPVGSGQTFTPPTNANAMDFTVERATPGQATTVHLVVVDGCGEWPTFVGGGTGAGF